MSEQDTPTTTEAAVEDVQTVTDEQPTDLGEPGRKALREEREARKQAERELKDLRSRIDAMEEAQNKTAEERAELERQREIERQAVTKANKRIVAAELRGAAKGVLADPGDALTFINPDVFEVDDDGNVDSDAITAALHDLVSKKPYLAARGDQRFEGSADAGARKTPKPTREALIADARQRGDWRTIMQLENAKLADLQTST